MTYFHREPPHKVRAYFIVGHFLSRCFELKFIISVRYTGLAGAAKQNYSIFNDISKVLLKASLRLAVIMVMQSGSCLGLWHWSSQSSKKYCCTTVIAIFQVTISQRYPESRLEESLSLRPTKLRPAATRKGLKIYFSTNNIIFFRLIIQDVNVFYLCCCFCLFLIKSSLLMYLNQPFAMTMPFWFYI